MADKISPTSWIYKYEINDIKLKWPYRLSFRKKLYVKATIVSKELNQYRYFFMYEKLFSLFQMGAIATHFYLSLCQKNTIVFGFLTTRISNLMED